MKYLFCVLFVLSDFSLGYSRPTKELEFYSQAHQDEFVYTLLYNLLDKQDNGYYLEIGAGHPISINNSYHFERNLNWFGVSIDISKENSSLWHAIRKNPLLIEDATQSDYREILEPFPQVIDYLSLDVDGYYDTVLEKVLLSDHAFKIITIEHDFYRYGDSFREKERKILTSLGYHLLCPDVSYLGNTFEDWWINPSAFSPTLFSSLASLNLKGMDHNQIIQIIQSYIGKN